MEILGTVTTNSAGETEQIGRRLGELASRGLFIGLSGDLGGGKTTITRGIARGLGINANITSPTFQLVREYAGRERLFHFDFYRLDAEADLLDLDILGCLADGVVVAEWSERFEVPGADDKLLLRLEWESENRRRIEINGAGGSGSALSDYLLSINKSEITT